MSIKKIYVYDFAEAEEALRKCAVNPGARIVFDGLRNGVIDGDGKAYAPSSFEFVNCKDFVIRNCAFELPELSFHEYSVVASDPYGINIRPIRRFDPDLSLFSLPKNSVHILGKEERFLDFINASAVKSAEMLFDGSVRINGDFENIMLGDRICVKTESRRHSVLSFVNCDRAELKNIMIFGSPDVGMTIDNCSNVTGIRVCIIPEPGSNLSSLSDGIRISDSENVTLNDCCVEGALGNGVAVVPSEHCGQTVLTGLYTRNCFVHSVSAPAGNIYIEGGLFDSCRDTAVYLFEGNTSGKIEFLHNRIIRRGRKYRFEAKLGAGGMIINGNGGQVRLIHNSIICPDTEGCVSISSADVTAYGNELLSLDGEKTALYKNCSLISEPPKNEENALVRSITSFDAEDDTELLRRGMKWLRETDGATLFLEDREYIIRDDFAHRLLIDTFKGKYGVNPEPIVFHRDFPYSIGLDLTGAQNVTLDGNGARILVDGYMESAALYQTKGVTIKNLTFDHVRRPFSHGYIIDGGRAGNKEFFGDDVWGDIFIPDQKYISAEMAAERCVVFDPETQRFISWDGRGEKKELIAPNTIRIHDWDLKDYVGYEMYIWHSYHYRPTILIWESKDVLIEDVRIHANNGMGIVGHRSENITMRRLAVVPAPGENMSTNGDATHFPSCKGTIRFENCLFEGQGDDSTNVHTYYQTILSADKNTCVFATLPPTGTHSQKADHPDPGDEIFICDDETLYSKDVYRVIEIEDIGNWTYKMTVDHDFPQEDYASKKHLFANLTQQPSVEMTGCRMRNHLARSVLIKTSNVLVEGCIFDCDTLNAVHICAEGGWREGTHATNVIVRNNIVTRRGRWEFGGYDNAGGIAVNIGGEHPVRPVHENIVIENNVISCSDTKRAIYAGLTKGLKIRNNKLLCRIPEQAIVIQRCENVETESNTVAEII